MSEELLIKHCSPTLAGIKTGSLFSCCFPTADIMRDCVRDWNKALVHKGLRVLPMRFGGGRALIYVYRPSRLCADLKSGDAEKILNELGYRGETAEHYVCELIKRLRQNEDFPHEIGLFLGYPPEDVRGFIENKASGCKCVGCWKVYGDECAAMKQFERYRKCTAIYRELYAKGRSLERLTVAA